MQPAGDFPLFRRLPSFAEVSNDLILDRFLDYLKEKGLQPYAAQEEAILALLEGKNVILNTPTGSGKSLVATALHFQSLALGKKSVYTSPIKALVNEKFRHLCREFGPDQVGMSTGDGSVNRDAPILCCTAEILANMALQKGELAAVDDVIMDEFHYYSDRDRGVAWQVPLLVLKRARFLLMSATLGDMQFFRTQLQELTGREVDIIANVERPVPLRFQYLETPLHESVKNLTEQNASPVYLVCFSQREAAEEAQNLLSVDIVSKEQKRLIAENLQGAEFASPYGKELQKFLKHGIGLHHAGLLPKYRVLVERLAQTGLLKVICGTDTLGVGVNIPIRTVLLTKLCKYDGAKTALLTSRDFHQISGRAGRKGFDNEGFVAAQAPAHVIENTRLEVKAQGDPKKTKKLVKVKPPDRGFVPWSKETFEKLIKSQPEALQSRFQITHSMLLQTLGRTDEDGCQAMQALVRHSHENPTQKKKHRAHGFVLFRSLVERGIVEFVRNSDRKTRIKLNVDLQEDFSLNHALGLYLIDTIRLLEKESETYALDVLTLVESILESPDLILRKQLDRVKTEKMREMKEAGVEYEERLLELEKLEHPKPLRDFVYSTFNAFSDLHPWVGTENIRPKSIAREMFETFQGFAEYIREYELQRAEGVLLRYLSDVYKALVQAVPMAAKDERFFEITTYFGAMVKGVDSSLLDEWNMLRDGRSKEKSALVESAASDASSDFFGFASERELRLNLMNEVFSFLRFMAIGDFTEVVALLNRWNNSAEPAMDSEGAAWTELRFENLAREYAEAGNVGLRTDTTARAIQHTTIVKSTNTWLVSQQFVDQEGPTDWEIRLQVNLVATRAVAKFCVQLEKLGPM